MRITAIAALMLGLALPAAAQETASANFIDGDGQAAGSATLTGTAKGVLIELDVNGLPANEWVAFHVHETGECDAQGGHESAGGHFNPAGAEHGFLSANGPHAGDMPNQRVGADGNLRAQVFNAMVTLDGENAIRGRALIFHGGEDDYSSQPSGDAGDRLLCAVIE